MFKLPRRPEGKNALDYKIDSFNSIVLLGANGSGKTRMSVWLEKNLMEVHRISAQKSLNFPDDVNTTSMEVAKRGFKFGSIHTDEQYLERTVDSHKWGDKPITHLLNDYEFLLILLHTENYELVMTNKYATPIDNTINYPKTKLDIVKEIWEQIFSHRKLNIKAGRIEVSSTFDVGPSYNSSEMSDGERLVFYFIGSVLCAEEKKYIIIDEPENHLHPSIIKKLWSLLELYRPECKFIFLTHDIDFAISRSNSKLIWIKNYKGNDVWDYEEVESNDLPKSLYLELLGSRNSVIFIEGDKSNSHDYALYQLLFKDYNVIALSSCNKVIEATKTFTHIEDLHQINAWGIIDRDRRTQDEVSVHLSNNILIPKVSEIENLFLLEEVVEFVANEMGKDSEKILTEHKTDVFRIFKREIKKEALQHTTSYITNKIIQSLNSSCNSFSEYEKLIRDVPVRFETDSQKYQQKTSEFQTYLDEENYNGILKVFNRKELFRESKIARKLGILDNSYHDFIFSKLMKNDEKSNELKRIFLNYIEGSEQLQN